MCVAATLRRMTSEPPAPQPVRASRWRRRAGRAAIAAGVALACLVMLCCCGVGYFGYDGYRAPHEEHDMEAFATELCHDILAGNANAIYGVLGADARHRYTASELTSGLAARGRLTRCEFVRATYVLLLVAYVVIADDHGDHTFDLVKESRRVEI
jgi:hypothetical protein